MVTLSDTNPPPRPFTASPSACHNPMPLPQAFWKELPGRSDGQLYDMLAHPDDYQPEALEAAQEELRKRNLAPERAQQFEAAAQSQKAVEDTKAIQPLGWPMRILIFMGDRKSTRLNSSH